MEYSYLTPNKLQILNTFLYDLPEDGLSYINIPLDLPHFDANTKIFYFKHITHPSPESLRLMYEYNNIIYYLEFWVWSGGCRTITSIKKELSAKDYNIGIYKSILKEAIKLYAKIEDKHVPYFYIKGKLTKNCDVTVVSKYPLSARITPDYELSSFNEAEYQIFTGKTIEETIILDTKYENLDFSELLDTDSDIFNDQDTFNCNITDFDGIIYDKFNYAKIHKLLYQQYQGSKCGWYGRKDHTLDNYLVIIYKYDKYMLVHYCIDSDSCSGWHFTLNTKINNSFRELWNKLNDQEKSALIKAHLK